MPLRSEHVANRADSTDAHGDARHFRKCTPKRRNFSKPRNSTTWNLASVYLAGIVQVDCDLGVSFDTSDWFDVNSLCHTRPSSQADYRFATGRIICFPTNEPNSRKLSEVAHLDRENHWLTLQQQGDCRPDPFRIRRAPRQIDVNRDDFDVSGSTLSKSTGMISRSRHREAPHRDLPSILPK